MSGRVDKDVRALIASTSKDIDRCWDDRLDNVVDLASATLAFLSRHLLLPNRIAIAF